MRNFFKITFIVAAAVIAAGYLIPERKAMPCCTSSDFNHQSFWHWPWTRGENGHPHTGIITPVPYVWRAFESAGTCNPPKRFNWRLMFWLDPTEHLPTE